MIDLSIGQTQDDLFPSDEVRDASKNVVNLCNNHAFQYAPEKGLKILRENISSWLNTKTTPSISTKNVLITNGASHALELIIKMFVPCGGVVVIEDPTYFFSLEILKEWNITIIPIKTERDGIDIDELEKILSSTKVNLLYIIPFNHNPTGATTSETKIQKLRALSERYDFYIASDEVYQFVGLPQPNNLYEKGHSKILSIGSFSKILGPGIRLGWIIGSATNINKLKKCGVLISGGGASPLMSLITAQIISSGNLNKIIDKLNIEYNKRREIFNRTICEGLPKDVKFQPPSGGFFGWIEFSENYNIERLVLNIQKKSVDVMVGSKCSVESNFGNCLRLGFTYYSTKDIEFACKQICNAAHEL